MIMGAKLDGVQDSEDSHKACLTNNAAGRKGNTGIPLTETLNTNFGEQGRLPDSSEYCLKNMSFVSLMESQSELRS